MSLSWYLKGVAIGFNVNIDEDVFAGLTRCLERSLWWVSFAVHFFRFCLGF